MTKFEGQVFDKLYDEPAGSLFENIELYNCLFDNCYLSKRGRNGERSVIRNAHIEHCKAIGCQIGPALFEDIMISNSTASDLIIFWGSLFHRVTISGRVSAFKINTSITGGPNPEAQHIYDKQRIEFYNRIDWAIDISNARFTSFDSKGLPARLFRLDPETQGVVRRKNFPTNWSSVIPKTNAWIPWVRSLSGDSDSDVVIAAPLAKPKKIRDKFLDDLKQLRELGIADSA